MIKIPIDLLMMLVISIIVLTFWYMVVGGPKCDYMANTTAFYLKNSIDQVAGYYPEWNNGVPPDEKTDYYQLVPIRLCQEGGVSFLETFTTGWITNPVPQYQIYYEHFPESVGVWTEAYPWSGGAMSSLKFWGAIRIAQGAWNIGKYANSAYLSWSLSHRVATAVGQGLQELKDMSTNEMVVLTGNTIEAMGIDKNLDLVVEWRKEGEYLVSLNKLKELGFVVTDSAGNVLKDEKGRIFIRNDVVSILLDTTKMGTSGDLTVSSVTQYVHYNSRGVIDGLTDNINALPNKDEWVPVEANIGSVWKEYTASLPSEERKLLNKWYVVEGMEEGGLRTKVIDGIKDTGLYKDVYEPVANKMKSWILKLKTFGYRVKTTLGIGERTTALNNAVMESMADNTMQSNGKTTGDILYDMIIQQDGVQDIIRKKLHLATADIIEKEHVVKFLQSVPTGGIQIIPKGMDLEVHNIGITIMRKYYEDNGHAILSTAGLYGEIMTHLDDESLNVGEDIVTEMGKTMGPGWTENEVKSRINDLCAQVVSSYTGGLGDTELSNKAYKKYFLSLANDYAGVNGQKAQDAANMQLGLIYGWVTQSTDALPMTPRTALKQYAERQVKKMIYLDGTALLNPGTTYQNYFFRSAFGVPTCEGNSICLLQKNMESPVYLNEETKQYSVKVWRPVETWKNFLGWQAAEKHIPSNPRFYVVSPCFAVAKVWKSGKTIFVYIDKRSTEGETSNYCIADDALINEYTAIWALSDTGTIIQTISGLSLAKSVKTATNVVGATKEQLQVIKESVQSGFRGVSDKIFNIADPVTLAQGIAEGVVSWPCYPWQPLNYDKILKYAKNLGVKTEGG